MTKSKGHVEFIDGYEYYMSAGKLNRAAIDKPLRDGRHVGEFITSGSGVEFALRMARIQSAD